MSQLLVDKNSEVVYAHIMYSNANYQASPIVGIIYIVLFVLLVVAFWKVFTKAGKPGWAAIIPIYNMYVLVKIAGRPGWWLLLFLIPFVNIVISLLIALDVAKAFGKSTIFGVFGLWLFSFIGYLILGFGKATYMGATSTPPSSPPMQTPPQAPPATQPTA